MARPTISDDEAKFMETLQKMGGSSGNTALKATLGWADDRYWRTHGQLSDVGVILRGRGRGGSVSIADKSDEKPLVVETPPIGHSPNLAAADTENQREADLYEPIAKSIRNDWVKERNYDASIVEITASPGRRYTGGAWTRPDISVLSMKTYPWLQGRSFEITTFEIKKSDSIDVLGVFEALSHAQFATRSYVVFCTSGASLESLNVEADRIAALASQHGVGVIVAADVADFETWDEYVEARRSDYDPEQANRFIAQSFSDESKATLQKWFK